MYIGENIKRLRLSVGMTQAEFGAIAGVSNCAVSAWELGNKEPRMAAVQKIADYFHISASEIIEGTPRDTSSESLKFALFGQVDVDDEVLEEVKRFAKFIQEKHEKQQP